MPEFNFDAEIDRKQYHSVKWRKYANRDILPMWVADMDFASPPAVLDVLAARIEHGVFGYGFVPPELDDAVVDYCRRKHQWDIKPDWLVWLPSLVCALNLMCRAYSQPGEAVATLTPIYPPFLTAPILSERRLVQVPLVDSQESWKIDIQKLDAAISPSTRLLMLCNPHNPVGRVYTRDELGELAAVAERHDLFICSDEVHCDLILDPQSRHIPIASLSPATAARTITLMAPSKTYNIAGLGCSFGVISNPDLRFRLARTMAGIVPHVNILGFSAALAAYQDSDEWHVALLDYLRGNRQRVAQVVATWPGFKLAKTEATYLAWLDCQEAGLSDPAAFFEAAGVGLSDGRDFGAPGFVRLNFGCTRANLDNALARMDRAIKREESRV